MEQHAYRSPNGVEQRGALLLAAVEKRNIPTNEHVQAVLQTLVQWNHPAKESAVIQLDIPRKLWMEKLANAGQNPEIATNDHFTVGHVHISRSADVKPVQVHLRQLCKQFGFVLLFESIRPSADQNTLFWQIAMLPCDVFSLPDRLFRLTAAMERDPHVRIASLSHVHVVYQATTPAELLREPDVSHPFLASASVFAYVGQADAPLRYKRLGSAGMLVHSAETPASAVETLIYNHGYSLIEAAGFAFAPDVSKQDGLASLKQTQVLFAASSEQEAIWIAGTDGTLWKTDTPSRLFIASEPYDNTAKPLAPGQPLALIRSAAGQMRWLDSARFRQEVSARLSNRRTADTPIAF
ncbi:hypothetical protein M493_02790 [Geobacillus genomosp. 3]|uniref:Glutamate synthase n=1 Tax=Geobacillus genomosp. 3 TaxID=1921421 RepID=S6A064_GEOG3|nr:hypothetical protein [Geobacillus genomosp. 3]AGT30891.1 hypothetical protein M493_02790 [Geobacillus genomosp. 3]